jgi:hypothetical protein
MNVVDDIPLECPPEDSRSAMIIARHMRFEPAHNRSRIERTLDKPIA